MGKLIERLRNGVISKIERWPGNDGEDIVHDIAGANELMAEAADALAAALSAQVQDVAGWKLVPKEPTQEMLDAADAKRPLPEFYLVEAYRAMLAAAPAKQGTRK